MKHVSSVSKSILFLLHAVGVVASGHESHASSLEDLAAIEGSIATRQMPPRRYRLLHPSSALSENKAKAVGDWVRYGKSQLDSK